MNSAEGARSRSRGAPAFLCVDRMVEDLSATLKRTGAGTVETAVLDPTVQMAADEEMHEAFDALAGAFDPGTAVMILGRLVGRGCALLSVSVKSAHERGDLKKSLRMVKRIVRRQRGAMRTVEGKNETRINLYFPVRNGSS